jgi:hypothetical protein
VTRAAATLPAWEACSSPASVTAPADGAYLFQARLAPAAGAGRRLSQAAAAAADTSALMLVTVDTTPPKLNITGGPVPLQSSPSVVGAAALHQPRAALCQGPGEPQRSPPALLPLPWPWPQPRPPLCWRVPQ